MSEFLPSITEDEKDLEVDERRNKERDEEIEADKPPHYEDWSVLAGVLSVFGADALDWESVL